MRKIGILSIVLLVGLCLSTGVLAVDKAAIQIQVDDVVAAIDSGKNIEDFKDAAHNKPYYVFILEEGGKALVHPLLAGKSLKKAAEPVYNELANATADGIWVQYVWKGKQKHTYVRKTLNGLIVGSGYSEQ